jgi:hypothetical protein
VCVVSHIIRKSENVECWNIAKCFLSFFLVFVWCILLYLLMQINRFTRKKISGIGLKVTLAETCRHRDVNNKDYMLSTDYSNGCVIGFCRCVKCCRCLHLSVAKCVM